MPLPLAILAGALCAIVVTVVALALAFFNKPTIAFYRLRPELVAEIAAQAADPSAGIKGGFRQILLDPIKPLEAQRKPLSACALVFTGDIASAAAEGRVLRWQQDEPSLGDSRELMPSSIRRIGTVDGETEVAAFAIPILLDHFELTCSIALLPALGDSRETSLERLVEIATQRRSAGHWPIVCAGGKDESLILLVSALAEAKYGTDGRGRIVDALRGGQSLASALDAAPLRATLDELVAWRKLGIIHPEWFRMADSDVRAFLDSGDCDMAFMTLSDRRTMPSKTMARYASLPFPATRTIKRARELTVPATVAFVPKGQKPNTAAMAFLARLVSPVIQGSLSRSTGLAPVNSTAETRDSQAYDARLWAASCARPVSDVAREAFTDPEDTARFARDIRGYLESGGTGF